MTRAEPATGAGTFHGPRLTPGRGVQAVLLAVTFAALVVSWSLIWKILLETPLIDVTLLEPILVVGGVALLMVRPWRLLGARDRPFVVLLAVYFGWFLVTAVSRGAPEDVKRALSYAVFGGVSFAIAFAAARIDLPRAARWVIVFFVVVLLVGLAGAALERATFPGPDQPDPLAPFWSLFRRTETFVDPRLGVLKAFPVHYPLGEPGLVRTAGVFAHPVYLGFFGILVTALMSALVIRSWRSGARARALLFVVGLGCAVVLAYWTYSRAALIGIVGVVGLTALCDLFARGAAARRWPSRADLLPGALVTATLIVVLGTSIVIDNAGLRRLAGTEIPGVIASDISDETSIEASAARSSAHRAAAQRVAVEMLRESPRALLLGTGMTAYEQRMSEEQNRGTTDPVFHPHNIWLTELLGGGIPALVLFVAVLGWVIADAFRGLRRSPDRDRSSILLWVVAWLPVWGLVGLVGLNPFVAQEAVILGSVLGIARAYTGSAPITRTPYEAEA